MDEKKAEFYNELLKLKRTMKNFESCCGKDTFLITLIISPKDQIAQVFKMLADKLEDNQQPSKREAIKSIQRRLDQHAIVPPRGLVILFGTIILKNGRVMKIDRAFRPNQRIESTLILCGNKFPGDEISALLTIGQKFGFIVMDCNGALFGTLQETTRDVLHKFTVDLSEKHGHEGQSALNFSCLQMEEQHNYVRKVSELAAQLFILNDEPNISGLILAGSADFKTMLSQPDMFDQRLQAIVLKLVEVSYDGEDGFNQAIDLSADILSNVRFIQEKKLIRQYLDEIAQKPKKYCFGVKETLKALELGTVEVLIVWENLDDIRWVLKNLSTKEEKVMLLKSHEAENNVSYIYDENTCIEYERVERLPLVEWLADNYKGFGARLEIITDRSPEGSQFVKDFGGIGGILRNSTKRSACNLM